MIRVPLRTVPGQNAREQHYVKARRVKLERDATSWELWRSHAPRPALPCTVRLTRVSPGYRPVDDDNLSGSLKGVRDEVAKWLGVDDGDRSKVRFVYAQRQREPWAVEIEFGEPIGEAEFIPMERAA